MATTNKSIKQRRTTLLEQLRAEKVRTRIIRRAIKNARLDAKLKELEAMNNCVVEPVQYNSEDYQLEEELDLAIEDLENEQAV